MIPVILGLGAVGYVANRYLRKKGEMSGDRQKIFQEAMNNLREPAKLKTLADSFQKEGLTKEADILRKRAALREESPAVKDARRVAFRKGLASTDKEGIETLAKEFEAKGAIGAAAKLRQRVQSLGT